MNVERFSLTLSDPLSTADGTIDAREGFVVEIEYEGTRGIGEATPLSGWTESIDACERALERARHACDEGWAAALAELDDTPAARHGLSLALCDARSRAADVPLHRYFGAGHTEQVPVNATIGDGSVDETVEAARAAVESGFETLKIKVGAREIEQDADRLLAVRGAVGPEIALRADANRAWNQTEAKTAIAAFADADLAYLEEPLSSPELAALESEIPVALDESLATHSVEEIINAGVADVLVLKPMVLGGPDRTLEIARAAREAGLETVLSTTVDGALARAGAVHVAANLPDPPAAGLATADRLAEDLIPDPAPIVDGYARVPQEPGNVPLSEDGR